MSFWGWVWTAAAGWFLLSVVVAIVWGVHRAPVRRAEDAHELSLVPPMFEGRDDDEAGA